jgi:hypothetical protein
MKGNLRIGELSSGGRRKTTVSKILIGTASSTDKTFIASGRFYPLKCNSPRNGCAISHAMWAIELGK